MKLFEYIHVNAGSISYNPVSKTMSNMLEKRITAVGYCGVDRYIDLGLIRPGGISLNFAMHARRVFPSTYEVGIVSAIGNDRYGQMVEKVLKDNGVRIWLEKKSGSTSVLDLSQSESGEKIFLSYEPGVLSGYVVGHEQADILASSDLVMAVVFSQIEPLFHSVLATRPIKFLATDFNNLAGYSDPHKTVEKYIPDIDIGFFGLSTKDKKLILDLKDISKKAGKILVVTLGENGSMAFNHGNQVYVPAFPVEKVVSTAGAGDAFAAMFLKNFLTTGNIRESLRAGNKYAATVVQKVGTY